MVGLPLAPILCLSNVCGLFNAISLGRRRRWKATSTSSIRRIRHFCSHHVCRHLSTVGSSQRTPTSCSCLLVSITMGCGMVAEYALEKSLGGDNELYMVAWIVARGGWVLVRRMAFYLDHGVGCQLSFRISSLVRVGHHHLSSDRIFCLELFNCSTETSTSRKMGGACIHGSLSSQKLNSHGISSLLFS